MKKVSFVLALAAAALVTLASAASATITSPAVGGAVSGSGSVTLRGNIISTTCSIAVGGTVTSTTGVNVTSATFSGCGSGASIVALGLPGTPWRKTITLSGTFTISGISVELTAAIGRCLYTGGLSGTLTRGANSTLTITADSLSFVRGSGLCSTNPTVTGTIRTNATVA